jgi:type III secretion system YscD/HrpQ family protein
MAAKLVAEEGILKGLVLSLNDGNEWVIGRDPDACQLLVDDPSASRKHLICRSTPNGIIAENLSTSNPIEINAQPIDEPRLLNNGDAVKIGNGMFRFYNENSVGTLNDAPPGNSDILTYKPVAEPLSAPFVETSLPEESPSEVKEEDPEKEQVINGKPHDYPEIGQETKTAEEEEAELEEEESELEEEPRHDTIFDEENDGIHAGAEINFDMHETGRWLLKVISGPNNGAEFSMQSKASYVLGTDPNTCDIIFHDTSVSRQHARISVGEDDAITIEDLKSRNGTLVDGQILKSKELLSPNIVVSTGTTSFTVYDREGEMQTIISPLLPSIVKVLQKEEPKAIPEPLLNAEPLSNAIADAEIEDGGKATEKIHNALGAFILIGIITGLFVIVGLGATTLFKSKPFVMEEQIDVNKALADAFSAFPSVKYSYNKKTGNLLLVGHVLTLADKNQLAYNLQGLHFIKNIDDNGVIIDEFVWQEQNQVLSKNPYWKGIAMYSTTPGHFVLSGYLQTRKQAEQLSEYIGGNFAYLDLLEKRIIVEEDVINSVTNDLHNHGIKDVTVQMSNGELSLNGGVPVVKMAEWKKILDTFKGIPGVRVVKNFVVEQAAEASMVNISDKYEVTGSSHQGGMNLNVVINGRILSRGDILDGMTITSIKPTAIYLEKEGVKYRIDFNR